MKLAGAGQQRMDAPDGYNRFVVVTQLACLIGHPVAHSRSPAIHGYWLKSLGLAGGYTVKDIAADGLLPFLETVREGAYLGCNVTVPHKEAVLPFLDTLDDTARAVGAVNTIWREGSKLYGGNTDVHGFLANLDEEAPEWSEGARSALVLGSGGAARAACYGLLQRGFAITIINRTHARAEALASSLRDGVRNSQIAARPESSVNDALRETTLLVNTTSLGMAGKAPLVLDLATLPSRTIVHDIVYVPLETELLRQARARGNRTVDGLGMLLHQAAPGFERWFGVAPRVSPALRALIERDIIAGSPPTLREGLRS